MEIGGVNSINGEIDIPGDKSISHRSAILSALADGTVIISNFLFSSDCISTLEILKSAGTKIETLQGKVIVKGCKGASLKIRTYSMAGTPALQSD